MRYSDFVDRVFLHEGLLTKLTPSDAIDHELVGRVRAVNEATLAGGRTVSDPAMLALVRGGLFYALDSLSDAHAIFQNSPVDIGSYWHGMMHRREADFDNARYWFRRAGVLPVFGQIHREASNCSATMARQPNWDPYLFTGQCEQERFGDTDLTKELTALQRVEFETLFDYCWRNSALG